jgi:serine/threonine protein kinase
MTCGHLAFPESNISRLLADKSKNRFKPLSSYDIKIPNYFADLIQQCMMHDKNRRPQTSSILSLELAKIYSKISHDKPEDVVVKYLGTSFKGRVSPKIYVRNVKINKIHFVTIFLAILLLYAVMIVSRKNHTNQQKIVSTRILDIQSLPTVDSTKKQPSIVKQDTIKKTVPSITKKTVENSSATHIEPKKAKSVPDKSQTIEKLKFKYDTDDLLLIAQKEISLKNTSNALAILNILDANATKSIRAQVLKSRALAQLDYRAFSTYVLSINTDEAELLLNKAKVTLDKGILSSAEILLNKAATAPREIISQETVSNEVLYYKAISSSKRFDIKPDAVTWREASEAWYIVKKEMRNQPSHEYYKKADDEISRISAKYRAIKG